MAGLYDYMARFSKKSLEGELVIDHSASPGMPHVPGGTILELATYTCAHCQAMVVKNPDRVRPRGWCAHCDKYVCDLCDGLECASAERFFDTLQNALERGDMVSSTGLILSQT